MGANYAPIVDALLESPNPIIRYKATVYLKGVNPSDKKALTLRTAILDSAIARELIADLKSADPASRDGIVTIYLTLRYLADIDYPTGDRSLIPYRDNVHAWLRRLEADYEGPLYIRDKYRVHGSFHGNVIHSSIVLGIDKRAGQTNLRFGDSRR
jgi:hypothetical protein